MQLTPLPSAAMPPALPRMAPRAADAAPTREGAQKVERAPGSLDAYYAPAQGLEGVKLLRTLHDLSERYHRERTYDKARHMMFAVVEDLDDDNVVTDLYTGREVKAIAGLRSATAKGLTTEHVWPQSEGATEEAKSDLHHLRAADGEMNTQRSNLPYGEVKEASWSTPPQDGVKEISLIGTDENGVKVFEPRASIRGDLARDQFYFFTRYHGDRPKAYSLDNFRVSLPTLVRWHEEDPVDDGERARNEAIFRLQGNRNPFVDHPTYVKKIGFNEALLRRRTTR